MRHFLTTIVCCGLVCSCLAGCSKETSRQSLEGVVTLDNAPLAKGSILFQPMPGTTSPSCGGTISDGRFSIAPAGGAACGKFRVQITATRPTGKKVVHRQSGNMMDEIVQYIPSRYNEQSKLEAVVESGKNRFSFDLTSKD